MFQEATRRFWNLRCNVGWIDLDDKGKSYGAGCMLSKSLVLTARHVINGRKQETDRVCVLGATGIFRCDIVFESSEQDLCVLRLDQAVPKFSREEPVNIVAPEIHPEAPFMGRSVGYLGSLRRENDVGEPATHTYFGQGYLSHLLQGRPGVYFGLSGGFAESGFSGGPCFTADGSLIGLIVESRQIQANTAMNAHQFMFPVMSAIHPVRTRLEELIQEFK